MGVPMVIGTTGLTDDEREAVEKAASKVPIVWAPNMSLGINLFFSLVKKAAEILGRGYKVEIDETHHVQQEGFAQRHGSVPWRERGQGIGR